VIGAIGCVAKAASSSLPIDQTWSLIASAIAGVVRNDSVNACKVTERNVKRHGCQLAIDFLLKPLMPSN
jgi:hypothetical protein